jgi:hypothetical protein
MAEWETIGTANVAEGASILTWMKGKTVACDEVTLQRARQ